MTSTGPALPDESVVRESVAAGCRKELASLDAALLLAVKLIQNAGETNVKKGIPAKTAAIALGLYAKSIKTVRAIRLAVSAGLLEDGYTLCRSLLETCAAIHYLVKKDSRTRGEEYLAHTILSTVKTANAWKATKGLKRLGRRLEKRAQKTLDRDFKQITQQRRDVLERFGYSGVSLENTFQGLGMATAYQTAYRSMSPHAHATEISPHLSFEKGRGLALHLGSSDVPEGRRLIKTTRWFFVGIMETISRTMGLGYAADIDNLAVQRDDPSIELMRAFRARVRAKRRKALAPLEVPRPKGLARAAGSSAQDGPLGV